MIATFKSNCPTLSLFTLFIVFPTLASAQGGTPFDSGLTALQNIFTGTIGKVASLIAIVVGGYQYLFKTNRPEISFADYDDPVVQAAVDQRKEFFAATLDRLYEIEISYAVVLEGARSKTGIAPALAQLFTDPKGGYEELRTHFSNTKQKTLLRSQIETDYGQLDQQVQSFVRQLSDAVEIEVLGSQECFTFLRRLVNYENWRIEGRPKSTQFLDYQVGNSEIEAERDHLRVGSHFVKVLTMRDAIAETRPLVMKALLDISANFIAVSEWVPLENADVRKEVMKRKRHFNI